MKTLAEKIKYELEGDSFTFWAASIMAYMMGALGIVIFLIATDSNTREWIDENQFFLFNICYIAGIIINIINSILINFFFFLK